MKPSSNLYSTRSHFLGSAGIPGQAGYPGGKGYAGQVGFPGRAGRRFIVQVSEFTIRSHPSSQVSQAAWALAVVWETMDFLAREYLYRSMTGLSPSVFL